MAKEKENFSIKELAVFVLLVISSFVFLGVCTFLIGLLIGAAIQLHWISSTPHSSYYLGGVLVIFCYLGVFWLIRKIPGMNELGISQQMTSGSVRFSLYLTMAILYFWVRYVFFSEAIHESSSGEVYLEVFLTFVALDSAFVAYKDHKKDLTANKQKMQKKLELESEDYQRVKRRRK